MSNMTPLKMKITAYEEYRFTGQTPIVATYDNLLFLKGATPKVNNHACYLPTAITVTNQAMVRLTVISRTAPEQASITGAITQTIQGGEQDDRYVYTCLLNLSEYSLQQGDQMQLAYADQTVSILINNDYTELTTLAYENEWGEYEFFECRGFITKNETVRPRFSIRGVDGKESKEVFAADNDQTFTLNTGFLQSQQEAEWLSYVLYSKKTYLLIEGVWERVILKNTKLSVYETRRKIHSYSLTFEIAVK